VFIRQLRLGFLLSVFLMANTCFSAVDPMRPPEYMATTATKKVNFSKPLILQMILVSEERKIAVINSATVEVGGVISGAKIVSIEKERVVASRKGKVVNLKMNSIEIIKGMAR